MQSAKGTGSRAALGQHQPGGPHVPSPTVLLPPEPFGAHVSRGSRDGLAERIRIAAAAVVSSAAVSTSRAYPQIAQFDAPRRMHEHVGGLDVPVEHAIVMQVRQTPQQLIRHGGQRVFGQTVGKAGGGRRQTAAVHEIRMDRPVGGGGGRGGGGETEGRRVVPLPLRRAGVVGGVHRAGIVLIEAEYVGEAPVIHILEDHGDRPVFPVEHGP
mmetsp:Transcript_17312/g.50321  ORF Transcript_17312/g.50321 Transcript_17312/m.50321 type:complete len:212 (-) Transcript_17312:259-894(-)